MDSALLWHLLMQDGRCVLCGQGFDLSAAVNAYGAISREHKQPASKGGKDGRRNLSLSHYECNRARGNSERLRLTRPGPKFWRRATMIDMRIGK